MLCVPSPGLGCLSAKAPLINVDGGAVLRSRACVAVDDTARDIGSRSAFEPHRDGAHAFRRVGSGRRRSATGAAMARVVLTYL
jgi:hypothetical protein